MTETPRKRAPRKPRVNVAKEHPMKTRASIIGLFFGLIGCSAFPIGSTLRLVCGTATGIVDIVEKVQRTSSIDAATSVDASVDLASLRDN